MDPATSNVCLLKVPSGAPSPDVPPSVRILLACYMHRRLSSVEMGNYISCDIYVVYNAEMVVWGAPSPPLKHFY